MGLVPGVESILSIALFNSQPSLPAGTWMSFVWKDKSLARKGGAPRDLVALRLATESLRGSLSWAPFFSSGWQVLMMPVSRWFHGCFPNWARPASMFRVGRSWASENSPLFLLLRHSAACVSKRICNRVVFRAKEALK